jgi:hypothetical protein
MKQDILLLTAMFALSFGAPAADKRKKDGDSTGKNPPARDSKPPFRGTSASGAEAPFPGIFPSGHTSTVAVADGVAACAKVVPTRMRKARKRKIIGRKRVVLCLS